MFDEVLAYRSERDGKLLYEGEVRFGIRKESGEYPDYTFTLNGVTRFAMNQNQDGAILSVIAILYDEGKYWGSYIGQKYEIGWVTFTEKEAEELIRDVLNGKVKLAFGKAYSLIISRDPSKPNNEEGESK